MFIDLYYFSKWIREEFVDTGFYGLHGDFKLHPSQKFFYRLNWDPKTRIEAEDECQLHHSINWSTGWSADPSIQSKDWGSSPIPLSQEENDQIAALMGGLNIWLGIQPELGTKYGYQNYWRTDLKAWGVRFSSGKMDWTNWRSDDMAIPDFSSGTQKMGAIISGSDGKWEPRDPEEKHYSMCLYRF